MSIHLLLWKRVMMRNDSGWFLQYPIYYPRRIDRYSWIRQHLLYCLFTQHQKPYLPIYYCDNVCSSPNIYSWSSDLCNWAYRRWSPRASVLVAGGAVFWRELWSLGISSCWVVAKPLISESLLGFMFQYMILHPQGLHCVTWSAKNSRFHTD